MMTKALATPPTKRNPDSTSISSVRAMPSVVITLTTNAICSQRRGLAANTPRPATSAPIR